MSVTSIIQQPSTGSLHAAYRAILSRVVVENISDFIPPAIVYCDIYINGLFYKTITRTFTALISKDTCEYVFDIQDAMQEYLDRRDAPLNGGVTVQDIKNLCRVYCKYRSSTYSPAGYIVPEGIVPQQATSETPAIPGGGLQSNSFYVINAVLQHNDNQDISSHLNFYKNKTWNAGVKPATHRPKKINILDFQNDYYPVIVPDDVCPAKVRIKYRYKDQTLEHTKEFSMTPICDVKVTNINTVQVPSTTQINFTWQTTDIVASTQYRIDEGIWITSTSDSATATLEEGEHKIEIRALCGCGIGEVEEYMFEVESPEVFVCESSVSAISFTQPDGNTINYSITASGAAKYKLELDGGIPFIVTSASGSLTTLTAGTHTLKVTPICSNDVEGTSKTEEFTVIGMPSISLLSSFVTGNDRVMVFKIGTHVSNGNRFQITVFGQVHEVTATSLSTPSSIAEELVSMLTKMDVGWYADNGESGFYPDPEDSEAMSMYPGQMPPYFTVSGDEITGTVSFPVLIGSNAYMS